MAKQPYVISFTVQGRDRLIAHVNRILRNVPNYMGQTSEELLLNKAMPASRLALEEAKVNYKMRLSNSFVIEQAATPSGRAYTMKNTQPYALPIETGVPSQATWATSEGALEEWRQAKGITGGDPNFVVVGQSGGGNRVDGKPYPKGVHFMKQGFEAIFGNLTRELGEALERGMR